MSSDPKRENKNVKIRYFSTAMEKEALHLLEKYGHTAEKRLKKAEKQNPRNDFFTRTFIGRKIADVFARRHDKKALAFFNQNHLEEAEKEIQLVMKWNPLFALAWLLKAKLEFLKGQNKEAVWSATCALKLDPNCSDALVVRSQAEVEQKHFASALADMIQISERFPTRVEPWLNAGLMAFHNGKMDQADLYIRRANELQPSFIGKMTMVKILLHHEKFGEAENLCREIEKIFWEELADSSADAYETVPQKKALLEKKPTLEQIRDTKEFYFNILSDLMIALFRQLKLDEMREVCEEILDFWPENLGARFLLAQVMMEKEELDQALQLFNQVLDVQPETPALHWFIGEILYKKKNFTEALPHLQTAVREKNAHFTEALHSALGCMCELGKEKEIFNFCSELIADGIKAAEIFFIRGSMFVLEDRIDDAMADFQRAVRLAPRNPECWLALAKIFVQKDRLKEAADATERALKIQPGMIEAGLIRVQALDILDRPEEAVRTIEKLIKNVSDPVSKWILKGDLCSRQNNFEEARKNYSRAQKRQPKHPIALLGRARVWELEENWQNAYNDISEAIQAAPDIKRFSFHRAVYAANLRNFQQAIHDCEYYMSFEPDDIRAILLLGEIRLEMKKPEAAIVLFQKVLEKDPKNVQALMHCAKAKVTLNLLESALNDVERAIGFAPQNNEVRVLHLQILIKLNREEEALKYCKEILKQFPENPSIHYNHGAMLLNLGHPEEALAEFEWVCEHDSEAVEPHYSRALALNALFRYEEAMEALNRVLEIRPDFIPALSEKAMTYSFMGDLDLSLKLLNKVLEKTPEDTRLLNFKGMVLSIQGRIKEAMEAFQKTVEIQPDNVPALSNLGHVQMLLGEWEKGLDSLNLAIQYNSKWGRPYLNRAMIYLSIRSLEEAEKDIEMALKIAKADGDEDLLVDAIKVSKRLKTLQLIRDAGFLGDSDSDEDLGDEDDPDDPDDFLDENDQDSDEEKDSDDDSNFWEGLFRFLKKGKDRNDFGEDLEDDSDDDWTPDSDEEWTPDSDEEWTPDSDEEWTPESEEEWTPDSDEDWDDDSDVDWDDDFDVDWDPDANDDGAGDFNWGDYLNEFPEEIDNFVDSKDGYIYLNSDFLRLEKQLNFDVQIEADSDKNSGPKFEFADGNETDSPNEVVSMGDESEYPVEFSLTYLDLVYVDEAEKKPATPAQIEQGSDFLRWVFQLWNEEKLRAQSVPEEDESEGEKEFEFKPPIIINCPEIFQRRLDNSGGNRSSDVPKGLDFAIPMANHIRYKANRAFFFEQLMEVGQILNQKCKDAKTPEQKDWYMSRQLEFEFLTELVMKSLINPENEILLVFTNFLTNPIMNELSGHK